jgi:serine protease Do
VKKVVKIITLGLIIVIIGGFSGIIAERFLMPWLSQKESLNKWAFFKKADENVTVINKTEQIVVQEEISVAKTAQKILPSVVKIVSYTDNATEENGNVVKKSEVIKDIKSSEDIQKKVKTGLIITNDGLIMSVNREEVLAKNEIKKNLKYKVLFSDEKEFDAELVLADEYSGLEFFKTNQENLPTPTFGNSMELEAGEEIIVIGNAGGEYQNSFSSGVISGVDATFTLLNSQLSSSEKIEGAILGDMKIDEKNLGGPVIDSDGNLVGIANFLLKDGEKEGFIMPINKLKSTIDKVVRGEELKRAKLGVYYLSIDKEIALLSDLAVSKGALVYSFSGQQGLAVKQGSPADLAGVKIGDIILALNNTEITLEKSLASLIAEATPGETVKLRLLRNEKELELEITLE